MVAVLTGDTGINRPNTGLFDPNRFRLGATQFNIVTTPELNPDRRFVAIGPAQVGAVGALPRAITLIGPALAGLFTRIGPTVARGGVAGARASRGKVGPAAVPAATNAVRTVSTGGRTFNLSGRNVFAIGAGTAATGFGAFGVQRLTEPGPSGSSAIETLTEGGKDIAENLKLPLEQITKFLQEQGFLVALIGLGIVAVVLIK